MDELLADFVAETREMLEASEGEIIAWEANPADRARLDAIFRFVHTVKGNCGFFDFPRLAALSHAAEDALADCRAERRSADTALVSAVLAIIDRIVELIDAIEAGKEFAGGGDDALIAALEPSEQPIDGTSIGGNATSTGANFGDKQGNTAVHYNDLRKSDASQVQRSIRLPVDLLDRVMSGVSDMVLARNDLAHRLSQAGTQPTIDGPFERLTAILSDVRDAITRMRMQRIDTLFSSLPRLVRDLSAELGKHVMIDLEGGNVELDREMIENLRDPLTHLIRNAIDHGIETPSARLAKTKHEIGVLSIGARQSGNSISIVVSDDGRGLDQEKIASKALEMHLITPQQREVMSREDILQLIFHAGFSTAETVSNVSGRGVGLDVVRENLEKVGGSIKVASTPDNGTLFTLQVPLTLSIIAGLTVEVGEHRFAIPQSYIEEVVHTSAHALDYTQVGDTPLVTFRGRRVPCLMLNDVLGLPNAAKPIDDCTLVMLKLASGDQFALAVESIYQHGDLVIKPLAPAIMKIGLFAGTSLLETGQPILLLDVTDIANRYGVLSEARTRAPNSQFSTECSPEKVNNRVMLFTDWQDRRCAVRLELVKRIETAPASAIDRSTSRPRAVADGMILPLVGLPNGVLPVEKVRLLRISDGSSELLYAVREVDDAAELTQPLQAAPEDPLIEAITLIDESSVLLMNVHEVFARYGQAPERVSKPSCHLPDNEWARTILGPLLTSAGYTIANGGQADITIVLEEDYAAANAVNALPKGPVIRLRSQPGPNAHHQRDEDPTVYRYDRAGVLAALEQAQGERLAS